MKYALAAECDRIKLSAHLARWNGFCGLAEALEALAEDLDRQIASMARPANLHSVVRTEREYDLPSMAPAAPGQGSAADQGPRAAP